MILEFRLSNLTAIWSSSLRKVTWHQATRMIIRPFSLCRIHRNRKGKKLLRSKCLTTISLLNKFWTIQRNGRSSSKSTFHVYGKIVKTSSFHLWPSSKSPSTIQMSFTKYSSSPDKELFENPIQFQTTTNSNSRRNPKSGIWTFQFSSQRMVGR